MPGKARRPSDGTIGRAAIEYVRASWALDAAETDIERDDYAEHMDRLETVARFARDRLWDLVWERENPDA